MTTALDRIAVTATYKNFDDTPAAGVVFFEVPLGVRVVTDVVGNEKLIPQNTVGLLDSVGVLSVVLPASDDPDVTPTGWTYKVTERIDGRDDTTYFIEVPYNSPGGTLNLADVAPADMSTGHPMSYVLLAEFNELKAKVAQLEEDVETGTGGSGTGTAVNAELTFFFDLAQGTPGAVTGQGIGHVFGDGWTLSEVAIDHFNPVDPPDGPIVIDVLKNGITVWPNTAQRLSLADNGTQVSTSTFGVDTADDGDRYTVNKVSGTVQTRAIVAVRLSRL